MAKRKKVKHRTRRRRMSGTGSGMGHDFMEIIGLVVGSVGTAVVQRQMTSVSPKVLAIGGLAGGYMLKKHSHSPLMTGISYGLLATSATHLTHDIGLIRGVEEMVSGLMGDVDMSGYIESEHMHGLSNESYMSGYSNENTMSGGDDMGYMG